MTDREELISFVLRLRTFIRLNGRGQLTKSPEIPGIYPNQSLSASTKTEFDGLALELFRLQFEHNHPYRRLCGARRMTPASVSQWNEIPAVPTAAFKEFELTSLAPNERSAIFLSSGTTQQQRSRHFHNTDSLALYNASLVPWFEQHLLGDIEELVAEQQLHPLEKWPLLILTPPPEAAPNSSLVHMFETVRREFGSRDSLFSGRLNSSADWALDIEMTLFAIRKSMCANRPLALLGTAFNFMHLLDHFAANNMRYRLAAGSRVLETGGYKGQSRQVPKKELHALITKHLGIGAGNIVTEYGMSELSSQAYDRAVGQEAVSNPRNQEMPEASPLPLDQHAARRVFHFPPWVRAQVISPESGLEVSEGESGLLRIFDLANVYSVMAIQTEDLAVRRGTGFELIGRAVGAEPRGCSLMSLNSAAGTH